MTTRQTRLFAAALTTLSLFVADSATRAQDAARWIALAPADESFSVFLPAEPSAKPQAALSAVGSPPGRLYEARGRDGVEYRVWSLERARPAGTDAQLISDYLDSCAEMAWTLVVDPEFKRATRAGTLPEGVRYGMEYLREFQLGDANTIYSAREYNVTLDTRRGAAYLFTDGARAYVVLAHGPLESRGNVLTFIDSFAVRAPGGQRIRMWPDRPVARDTSASDPSALEIENPHPPAIKNPHLPTPATIVADPVLFPSDPRNLPYGDPHSKSTEGSVGPERNADTSAGAPVSCDELNKRVFTAKGVMHKAQILARPEPTYTEWARKFSVTGTVRLRGVLSADGTVTNIVAITRLPHGLTRNAVEAFRAVRFEPAQKDGCNVAQYVMIDYNFNIY